MSEEKQGGKDRPEPPGPGRAAYEKWAECNHELDDYDRDLSEQERGQWYSIGQAAIDGSAYVRGLEREAAGRDELAEVLSSPAELARWVEINHGDHPQWVAELRTLLPADSEPGQRYALVEQMGFRRTYGTVRETEFCGKPMLEVTSLETGAVCLTAPESLYQVTWLTRQQAESATRTGSHSPRALSAAIADDLASWGADDEYGDDDGGNGDDGLPRVPLAGGITSEFEL